VEWRELGSDSGVRTARARHHGYDGGCRPDCAVRQFGDSWSFDGIHWTQVQDIGPVPRLSHAVTFDSARNAVVLFGGLDATDANLGDTWEHKT